MAHLLSLTMKSFKSFSKLTTINFARGLTGIVGPNGSGKSNIMDALFFVIGSSRITLMRAKKGGELIFNSKTQKPPFAEVRLVIDNADKAFGEELGDEVTISRKVKHDGASAYRVNGRRMKRLQVTDLLSRAKIFPDGHNIVQQGEIAGLVKQNSQERREIIDEIAGIKEYEEKKQKAALELAAVEQKVAEINSLLRERQRNLERLKKERQQAMKHERLQALKRVFEASLVKRRIEEHEASRTRLSAELETEDKGLASVDEALKEALGKIDAVREEIRKIDLEISAQQSGESIRVVKESEKLSGALQAKRDRVKFLRSGVSSSRERRKNIAESELPSVEKRIKALEEKIESIESELSKVSAEISEREAERVRLLSVFSEESKEESRFEEQKAAVAKSLSEMRRRERELVLEQDSASARAARSEEERSSCEKGLSELKASAARKKEEAKKLEAQHAKLLSRVRDLEREAAALRDESASVERSHDEAQGTASAVSARLETAGSLKVDEEIARVRGFAGRISESVKPKKPEYTGLLGGEILKRAIAVETRSAAEEVAGIVARRGLERTFIVVLEGRPSGSEAQERAREFFSFRDDLFVPAISAIISGRARVGSIRQALSAGDAFTDSGVLVAFGGRLVEAGATVLREQLEEDLSSARKALEKLKARRAALSVGSQEKQVALNSAILEEKQLFSRISSLSPGQQEAAEARRLSEKLLAAEKERDGALAKKDAAAKELAGLRKSLAEAEESERALQAPEKRKTDFQAISRLEGVLSGLRKRQSDLALEKQEHVGRMKNQAAFEAESLRKLSRNLEGEEAKMASEAEGLEKDCAGLEERVKALEEEVSRKQKGLNEAIARKEKISVSLAKEEQKRYELMARRSAIEGKKNLLTLRREGEESEIAGLSAQIAGETRFVAGTARKLQAKIEMFGRRMARLGAINQMALTQFEEAQDEFKEVETRKETLESEKGAILNFMAEVEKRKRDVFMEHYLAIALNFTRIYSRLSGGTGSLSLENPEAPFDGGLTIAASPPGKQVLRIDLLSGGEQTIAALAFIFSVQEHTPAPFYVFDEVEAALDKDNSQKLATLLSGYSESSQIVVITHNDAVMRSCDELVGVFMNKGEGVSKIISQPTPEFLRKINRPQVQPAEEEGGVPRAPASPTLPESPASPAAQGPAA